MRRQIGRSCVTAIRQLVSNALVFVVAQTVFKGFAEIIQHLRNALGA